MGEESDTRIETYGMIRDNDERACRCLYKTTRVVDKAGNLAEREREEMRLIGDAVAKP